MLSDCGYFDAAVPDPDSLMRLAHPTNLQDSNAWYRVDNPDNTPIAAATDTAVNITDSSTTNSITKFYRIVVSGP